MGDFRVRGIRHNDDRRKMYEHALRDIEAFEYLLRENAFTSEPLHIGAEQELCIVDRNFQPSSTADTFLDLINDDHYTNEVGLFNLEINLDPHRLGGTSLSDMENHLMGLLDKGQKLARKSDETLMMAGILPTIKLNHLTFDHMTPIDRYQTLSQALFNIRGGDFEIYLQGVDDLMASIGSVLFEACNTSFQLHQQIDPAESRDKYNWAQMISGPVLACCVNSPLLLGRELWAETRIALFKQSLDTRSSKNHRRMKVPRVYFGDRWLQDSPAQLWKNELMRFPLLVTSDDFEDAHATIRRGETPDLRAIRLHTGTTYTWNRLCYGPGKQPHLRIECRYLPAGPSVRDEVANLAFWVGLMSAMPEDWGESVDRISFRETKDNFIRAARNGLHSGQHWYGKSVSAQKLLLDTLLPMAHEGLKKCGIADVDREAYLDVIEQRVARMQTGADWLIQSQRNLVLHEGRSSIAQKLVAQSIKFQKENRPVCDWKPITRSSQVPLHLPVQRSTVGHIMSTDVFTVHADTSIEFANKIMAWNNIHHLPVEDEEGNLVGQVDAECIAQWLKSEKSSLYVSEIMSQPNLHIDEQTSLAQLKDLLSQENDVTGVCVTSGGKIVGIATMNDLEPYLEDLNTSG